MRKVVKLHSTSAARKPQGKNSPDMAEPKAASLLAEAITLDVVRRGWPLGVSLGTESELIDHYKVSRATLREAVRELERQGVTKMLRGTGLVIAEPARTTAVRALTSYIRFSCIGREEIADVQKLLRVHAVGLATAHLDDAGILRLRALKDALTTARHAAERDYIHNSLRKVVSDLSGNPLISVLLDALEPFGFDSIGAEDLVTILEDIISGNRHRAEELTRTALERQRELPTNEGSSGRVASVEFRTPKLGQAISEEIAREAARANWSASSRLGTEEEMRNRYGVSHAIIRESLSLLERHGIILRQRGRTGGLLIRQPDPTYTVKVVTGFFRFMRLSADNLVDARRLLEPEAAARAAGLATPDALAALHSALQLSLDPKGTEAGRAFYVLVANASGNRVLSLFVQALMATFYSQAVRQTQAFRERTFETSEKVFEAIAAGDAALARRRSLQHLDWAAQCLRQGVIRI